MADKGFAFQYLPSSWTEFENLYLFEAKFFLSLEYFWPSNHLETQQISSGMGGRNCSLEKCPTIPAFGPHFVSVLRSNSVSSLPACL